MRNTKKGVFNKPPLYCWDFFMQHYQKSLEKVKVDHDLQQLNKSLKHKIELPTPEYLVEESYDALVVTNRSLKIVWASKGFVEMTGYSRSYAVGKSPKLLQGAKTSNKAKQFIRQELKKKKPFRISIINYKKNGDEYLCSIKLLPLIDKTNRHTHYLAIEREVRMAQSSI